MLLSHTCLIHLNSPHFSYTSVAVSLCCCLLSRRPLLTLNCRFTASPTNLFPTYTIVCSRLSVVTEFLTVLALLPCCNHRSSHSSVNCHMVDTCVSFDRRIVWTATSWLFWGLCHFFWRFSASYLEFVTFRKTSSFFFFCCGFGDSSGCFVSVHVPSIVCRLMAPNCMFIAGG